MTRTGWALSVGALALLAAGSIWGMRELVVIGAACALAVVVGMLLGRRRPSLTVERSVDPVRATVGDVALASVTLGNGGTRPVSGVSFDEKVGSSTQRLAFSRFGPGQTRSITYRIPTERRSAIQLGPGSVRSADPFGVFDSDISLGGSTEFIVHPRRFPITSFPRASRRAIEGPEAQKAALGSMMFHTLREYVPGDDLRHVHWKSSARSGSLMVRQFVDTDIPELTVVLDVTASVYDGDNFESACEAAASIIDAFHRQGFSVRFMTSAGTAVLGGSDTVQLLDFIARLNPMQTGSLSNAVQAVATRPSGVAVTVVTGRADESIVRQVGGLGGGDRTVVLAEIREDASSAGTTSSGDVRRIQTKDGEDFARLWNATVRW